MGIRDPGSGKNLSWISDPGVKKISENFRKKISVLQGSILGPILFLCFLNDLYSVTELLTLIYADDTFSLESGDDLHVLANFVNAEINKMAVWFRKIHDI